MNNENTKCTGCDPAEGFCRDCRAAQRATTASAAPTTVQMPESGKAYEYSSHLLVIPVGKVKAYGDARAEEARREADEAARKETRDYYEAKIADLFAQRTAGGEAVKVECKECNGTGSAGFGDRCSDCNGKGYDWEPVAEAAAQADDDLQRVYEGLCYAWGFLTGHGADTSIIAKGLVAYESLRAAAPTAQPTPCPFLGSSSMTRGEGTARELHAAMEAAQPTPNENAPCLGRGVLGTEGASTLEGHGAERDLQHVPTYAEDASLAQPTLPDDGRAAFEAHYRSLYLDDAAFNRYAATDAYENPTMASYWHGWKARAALRQPGALPDHEIAAMVNKLRDTAIEFRDAQQLRARIADIVVPALKWSGALPDETRKPLKRLTEEAVGKLAREHLTVNVDGTWFSGYAADIDAFALAVMDEMDAVDAGCVAAKQAGK